MAISPRLELFSRLLRDRQIGNLHTVFTVSIAKTVSIANKEAGRASRSKRSVAVFQFERRFSQNEAREEAEKRRAACKLPGCFDRNSRLVHPEESKDHAPLALLRFAPWLGYRGGNVQ